MKQSRGLALFLLILIVVGMPFGFGWAYRKSAAKEKEYTTRGVWVTGTVTGITETGSSQSVIVTYKTENGERIEARAILNKRVNMGDTAGGYVLPEEPGEIFVPAEPFLKWVFYILAAVIWLGSLFAVVSFFKSGSEHKRIMRRGLPVRAELVGVKQVWETTMGSFRFVTSSGQEYTKDLPISHGSPYVGDSYDILYYEKNPGKCVAEVIDMRIK